MPVPYSIRISWSGFKKDSVFRDRLYGLLERGGCVVEKQSNGAQGITRNRSVFKYDGSNVIIIEHVAEGMQYFDISVSNPVMFPKDLTDKIKECGFGLEAKVPATL